ncbi:MAG TPA: CDP-alcohol phosphatidyltransferase family protein [Acidiferrobacteraceae bacterium]|nr:CDP-alcohol phosphatidyltransferase family protein [Acidiferrobacteraceae bacterium]
MRKLDHLPNAITMSRVALVPVLILLLRAHDYPHALVVFAIAGFSDALDGFIAKRFGLVSQLGAVLDPLADKILLISAYVMLALLERIPFWLVLLVVFRDLLIVGGYLVYASLVGAVQMRPSLLSKLNTLVQILLVVMVLTRAASGWPSPSNLGLLIGLAGLTTAGSGLHYIWSWLVVRAIEPVAEAGHD